MRGKHRKDQVTLDPEWDDRGAIKNPYFCGCGETFSERDGFRNHNISMHFGQFVDKSSHFLAHMTSIVLPVVSHLSVKIFNQDVREEDDNCILDPEKIGRNEEVMEMKEPKLKIAQLREAKRGASFGRNEVKEERKVQQQERLLAQSNEPIEWNGFKLIRNRRIQSNSFFCGKCVVSFSDPEEYVVHCIQICEELKDLRSSHFIYSHLDDPTNDQHRSAVLDILANQQKKVQIQEEPPRKYPGKKRGRKKKRVDPEGVLPEPIPQVAVHYDAQASRQRVRDEPVQNKDGILCLYRSYRDENKKIYVCGACHKIYTYKNYLTHIQQSHAEVVPVNSSHIVIRYYWRTNKSNNYFLSIIEEEGKPQMFWYCPCKPGIQMTHAAFVEHQMDVHFGISMIYTLV